MARITSPEDLRRFFAACDQRETNPEPDWEEHRKVLARSRNGQLSGYVTFVDTTTSTSPLGPDDTRASGPET